MCRLIRKAVCRDEQGQTMPSVPSASVMREATAGKPIDGPPPIPFSRGASSLLPGLDTASSPILFVRHPVLTIFYVNPATEAALVVSHRQLVEMPLYELLTGPSELAEMIVAVVARQFDAKRRDVSLGRLGREPPHAHAAMSALDLTPVPVLLELLPNGQEIHSKHEERLLDLTSTNKELIHNLAHEIKDPLGGIRGAAQPLEFRLSERSLREYTQVIIKGFGRLQMLVDRLFEPHRHPHIASDMNIHEVLERVRSVVLVELPQDLHIARDCNTSLPESRGNEEQFIQAVFNIVHDAAYALGAWIAQGDGETIPRTRTARKVTITKRLYKLALDLHVVDNGPGIPDDIRERVFFPLVSGREGGSGLGLILVQTFAQQHDDLTECGSRPGQTDLRTLAPLH